MFVSVLPDEDDLGVCETSFGVMLLWNLLRV